MSKSHATYPGPPGPTKRACQAAHLNQYHHPQIACARRIGEASSCRLGQQLLRATRTSEVRGVPSSSPGHSCRILTPGISWLADTKYWRLSTSPNPRIEMNISILPPSANRTFGSLAKSKMGSTGQHRTRHGERRRGLLPGNSSVENVTSPWNGVRKGMLDG